MPTDSSNDYALVLSGGGARGAYQAGALRAIYEIGADVGNLYPFRNLVGVSAGAINAAYLASEAGNLDLATAKMCAMWRKLTSTEVFQVDTITVTRTALRLLRGVALGGFSAKMRPSKLGLLNVNPLRDLLAENISFAKIPEQVANGHLNALCITATDYSTALGVTFFTGNAGLQNWKRVQRLGIRSEILVDHIMGSAAIPIFFPPWNIAGRHYGDGCLRNSAPLSPARHIGARKLLVVGVRKWRDLNLDPSTLVKPSLGRVISVVINALFMDAIESDIERVRIINESLEMAARSSTFRKIDILYMQPSQAPSELAETRMEGLPPLLRFLIGGLGSAHESSELLSYLTFDPLYLNALVDLGYYDIMKQKETLTQFLRL